MSELIPGGVHTPYFWPIVENILNRVISNDITILSIFSTIGQTWGVCIPQKIPEINELEVDKYAIQI